MIVNDKEGKRVAQASNKKAVARFIEHKVKSVLGKVNYKPKHLESKTQRNQRKAVERKALILACVLSLCSVPFVDYSIAVTPDTEHQVVSPENLAEAHLVLRNSVGAQEITVSDLSEAAEVVALPITDEYHVKVAVTPEPPSEVLAPAKVAVALSSRRPMGANRKSGLISSRALPMSLGLGEQAEEAGLSVIDLSVANMVSQINILEAEEIAAEQARLEQERIERERLRIGEAQIAQGYLVATDKPDPGYTGVGVIVQGQDRDTLERLVMGEAGNQGFAGAALVAQCIRDAIVFDGYKSVEEVRQSLGYSGRLVWEPNQNVKDAVAYIFDQGQSAVQHRILYFYSSNGGWHETQNFIVQVGAHRFFDRWW